MKQFLLTIAFSCLLLSRLEAQVDQYDPACSTPDLDSATAVSLPWYNNNQLLENLPLVGVVTDQHTYSALIYSA